MSGYDWPDRDTWAKQRRTVYADDLDTVTAAVSADPAEYATQGEITRATAELGDYWRQLGRDLRVANREALAAFPLHNTRARRRRSVLAIAHARDLLSAEEKAIVEHAEAVKHHRHLVNAAIEELNGSNGHARLHRWTIDNAERWMPADACPTWKTIARRWKAAQERAAAEYAEQVRHRPVDDQAWQKELDRRADIERNRGVIHTRPAVPVDNGASRFQVRPAGLTDAEWRNLQRLDAQAASAIARARSRES